MRIRLLPADLPITWWLPYSWLVYLSFFIAYAVLRPMSASWQALHALAVLVFLAMYFRGFWLDGKRLQPIVVGITALGTVLIPWNPGASVFFVYASGFVGDIARPAVAARWLGAIVLVVAVETVALQLPPTAWIPAVLLPIIIGGGNIAYAEKHRADSRLRLAQAEVEHLAKVAERERIARDLHDLLGHTLSVIVLKSELAAKLSDGDPRRAAAEIRDVERISREALSEIRRAVQGYRALTLDESLARARQALDAAGVRLVQEVAPVRLDPKVEGVVSLVLCEATTNVVRHARAAVCSIRIAQDQDRVRVIVHDDGVGGSIRPGVGVSGMRARVEEVGGRFDLDGLDGTTLCVDLPLRAV